jgi:hypothetical protein
MGRKTQAFETRKAPNAGRIGRPRRQIDESWGSRHANQSSTFEISRSKNALSHDRYTDVVPPGRYLHPITFGLLHAQEMSRNPCAAYRMAPSPTALTVLTGFRCTVIVVHPRCQRLHLPAANSSSFAPLLLLRVRDLADWKQAIRTFGRISAPLNACSDP